MMVLPERSKTMHGGGNSLVGVCVGYICVRRDYAGGGQVVQADKSYQRARLDPYTVRIL